MRQYEGPDPKPIDSGVMHAPVDAAASLSRKVWSEDLTLFRKYKGQGSAWIRAITRSYKHPQVTVAAPGDAPEDCSVPVDICLLNYLPVARLIRRARPQ